MTVDVTKRWTRRAVIAGAIGGTATLAASAMSRPGPADAADGDAVQVGNTYSASTVTVFDAGGTSATALEGDSGSGIGLLGSSDSGIGVKGICPSGIGVWAESTGDLAIHAVSDGDVVRAISDWGEAVAGNSTDGTGVAGHGFNGPGVSGDSQDSQGVGGYSWSTGAPGVQGRSLGGNTGVFGYSGSAPWTPTTPAQTGVYGYADQGTSPRGVYGQTTLGNGVHGLATTGIGMRAMSTTGTGVYATVSTGTAIYAATGAPKSGTALRTVGRVRFDKSVGIATIATGASSVIVTPGIDLTTTSAVVATLQANPAGTVSVQGVVVNATADTFTIYLTASVTSATKVAWHVFG